MRYMLRNYFTKIFQIGAKIMKEIIIQVFPIGFIAGAGLSLMIALIGYTINVLIRTIKNS